MSTDDDLRTALREHADSVAGTPLTFDGVRGRARQIRRRRTGSVAAGLALVAAIVLPVALLGGAGSDKSDDPPVAPSPTRAIDPADRGVPTIQDGVLIYPNGPRFPIRIGQDRLLSFAELGTDRWVLGVGTEDEGRTEATVIDATGQVIARYPMGSPLAAADDGSAVAWVDPQGTTQLLVADATEPRELGSEAGRHPTAVAITGDCSATCEVVGRVDGDNDLGSSWIASTTGTVRSLPSSAPLVVDASSDGALLAALDGRDDDDIHLCGGVFDVGADAMLWRRCEDNVFEFSPDGALVMTTFAEGLGPNHLELRDSYSGAAVAELTGSLITSYAWEDSTHLLAVVVEEDGSTSVQRISAGTTPEIVLSGFHTDDPTIDVPVQLPLN